MDERDIRELRVAEIMEQDWPTLGPDATVEEAIKLFAEARISGAPVVSGGNLIGIVTEGDLIFRDAEIEPPGFMNLLGGIIPLGDTEEYRREALKSAGVTVDEVMTEDVTTVGPDKTLAETATVMAEERKKILPVVEADRLVGAVTRMDILTLHILNPRR